MKFFDDILLAPFQNRLKYLYSFMKMLLILIIP